MIINFRLLELNVDDEMTLWNFQLVDHMEWDKNLFSNMKIN